MNTNTNTSFYTLYDRALRSLTDNLNSVLMPGVNHYEKALTSSVANIYYWYSKLMNTSMSDAFINTMKSQKTEKNDYIQIFLTQMFDKISQDRKNHSAQAARDTAYITVLLSMRYLDTKITKGEWKPLSLISDGYPSIDDILTEIGKSHLSFDKDGKETKNHGTGVFAMVKAYNNMKKRQVDEAKHARALAAEQEEAHRLGETIKAREAKAVELGITVDEVLALEEKQLNDEIIAEKEKLFLRDTQKLQTLPVGLPDGVFVSMNGITYIIPFADKLDIINQGATLLMSI